MSSLARRAGFLLSMASLSVACSCMAARAAEKPIPKLPEAEPDPFKAPEAALHPLYLQSDAPLEARVHDLLGRMTLEEKAAALDHVGPTLQRFGLRSDKWNQCLNGVNWSGSTTLFPACIAMGASWNPDLVEEVAQTLSDEARAIYNAWKNDPNFPEKHSGLIYRAPVINIARNPFWGRNHEVWSEDPFLTGRMGVAYVRGLQGNDPKYLKIAATLKHFAVNNVERDRKKLNAIVSERYMREYWLPHWKEVVQETGAASLMASYNAINGQPNNKNAWLLTDLLKKEWGHDGFVVSDLGGVATMVAGHSNNTMSVQDAVASSVMAGCDFSDREYRLNIPAAVREGKLSLERLDDAVRRVLKVRFRLGEFDSPALLPWAKLTTDIIDSPAHHQIALKAARQAMVLLQNRDGFLPLKGDEIRSIAVLGAAADRRLTNNYNGRHDHYVTPLAALRERLGANKLLVESGENLQAAVEAARQAQVALVFVTSEYEMEGHDRKSLGPPPAQQKLVEAVLAANPRCVVVQMSAGPLTFALAKSHAPAILQAWWPGSEGGHALADVLLGTYNPAGRLPSTVYADESQVPPTDEYDISKGFTYMYLKGEPLWPFGHGLSYARFDYSGLQVASSQAGGKIEVEVTVANASQRDGDEVVQVYVVPPKGDMPNQKLLGFARVGLEAGKSRQVKLTLSVDKLAYWDVTGKAFALLPGEYQVQVGGSSKDIRLKGSFRIDKP